MPRPGGTATTRTGHRPRQIPYDSTVVPLADAAALLGAAR